ncbi:hypothetical protein BJX70DRAFT_382431 [Aspergillus crustosus]
MCAGKPWSAPRYQAARSPCRVLTARFFNLSSLSTLSTPSQTASTLGAARRKFTAVASHSSRIIQLYLLLKDNICQRVRSPCL